MPLNTRIVSSVRFATKFTQERDRVSADYPAPIEHAALAAQTLQDYARFNGFLTSVSDFNVARAEYDENFFQRTCVTHYLAISAHENFASTRRREAARDGRVAGEQFFQTCRKRGG